MTNTGAAIRERRMKMKNTIEENNQWIITRTGSNTFNQSMCEELPLLILDAPTAAEAREEFNLIWSDSVTLYANQNIFIENAAHVDEDEWDALQETDYENRRRIRDGQVI